MKNRYKRDIHSLCKRVRKIEKDESKPDSFEQFMAAGVKRDLDEACLTIDEVCIQGVLKAKEAASLKERMCITIMRSAVAQEILPPKEDPFMPAHVYIGYEMPVSTHVREPRPWQLPGWKSPWMMQREYLNWLKLKQEKQEA